MPVVHDRVEKVLNEKAEDAEDETHTLSNAGRAASPLHSSLSPRKGEAPSERDEVSATTVLFHSNSQGVVHSHEDGENEKANKEGGGARLASSSFLSPPPSATRSSLSMPVLESRNESIVSHPLSSLHDGDAENRSGSGGSEEELVHWVNNTQVKTDSIGGMRRRMEEEENLYTLLQHSLHENVPNPLVERKAHLHSFRGQPTSHNYIHNNRSKMDFSADFDVFSTTSSRTGAPADATAAAGAEAVALGGAAAARAAILVAPSSSFSSVASGGRRSYVDVLLKSLGKETAEDRAERLRPAAERFTPFVAPTVALEGGGGEEGEKVITTSTSMHISDGKVSGTAFTTSSSPSPSLLQDEGPSSSGSLEKKKHHPHDEEVGEKEEEEDLLHQRKIVSAGEWKRKVVGSSSLTLQQRQAEHEMEKMESEEYDERCELAEKKREEKEEEERREKKEEKRKEEEEESLLFDSRDQHRNNNNNNNNNRNDHQHVEPYHHCDDEVTHPASNPPLSSSSPANLPYSLRFEMDDEAIISLVEPPPLRSSRKGFVTSSINPVPRPSVTSHHSAPVSRTSGGTTPHSPHPHHNRSNMKVDSNICTNPQHRINHNTDQSIDTSGSTTACPPASPPSPPSFPLFPSTDNHAALHGTGRAEGEEKIGKEGGKGNRGRKDGGGKEELEEENSALPSAEDSSSSSSVSDGSMIPPESSTSVCSPAFLGSSSLPSARHWKPPLLARPGGRGDEEEEAGEGSGSPVGTMRSNTSSTSHGSMRGFPLSPWSSPPPLPTTLQTAPAPALEGTGQDGSLPRPVPRPQQHQLHQIAEEGDEEEKNHAEVQPLQCWTSPPDRIHIPPTSLSFTLPTDEFSSALDEVKQKEEVITVLSVPPAPATLGEYPAAVVDPKKKNEGPHGASDSFSHYPPSHSFHPSLLFSEENNRKNSTMYTMKGVKVDDGDAEEGEEEGKNAGAGTIGSKTRRVPGDTPPTVPVRRVTEEGANEGRGDEGVRREMEKEAQKGAFMGSNKPQDEEGTSRVANIATAAHTSPLPAYNGEEGGKGIGLRPSVTQTGFPRKPKENNFSASGEVFRKWHNNSNNGGPDKEGNCTGGEERRGMKIQMEAGLGQVVEKAKGMQENLLESAGCSETTTSQAVFRIQSGEGGGEGGAAVAPLLANTTDPSASISSFPLPTSTPTAEKERSTRRLIKIPLGPLLLSDRNGDEKVGGASASPTAITTLMDRKPGAKKKISLKNIFISPTSSTCASSSTLRMPSSPPVATSSRTSGAARHDGGHDRPVHCMPPVSHPSFDGKIKELSTLSSQESGPVGGVDPPTALSVPVLAPNNYEEEEGVGSAAHISNGLENEEEAPSPPPLSQFSQRGEEKESEEENFPVGAVPAATTTSTSTTMHPPTKGARGTPPSPSNTSTANTSSSSTSTINSSTTTPSSIPGSTAGVAAGGASVTALEGIAQPVNALTPNFPPLITTGGILHLTPCSLATMTPGSTSAGASVCAHSTTTPRGSAVSSATPLGRIGEGDRGGGLRPQKRRVVHRVTRIPLPSSAPVIQFSSLLQHPFAEDRYEVKKKISEGTYGEVYLAEERFSPFTCVALKRLKRLNGLDGFPLPSLREVTALQHIEGQRKKMLNTMLNTLISNAMGASGDPSPTRGAFQEEGTATGPPHCPTSMMTTTVTTPFGGPHPTLVRKAEEKLAQILLDDEDKDPLPNIIHLREVLLSSTPASSSCDICLVFDFVDHSLAGLLGGTGGGGRYRFEIEEIAYIFRRLLVALSRLHAMGIIHRDIKADNLLLSKDGRVFLADFGLCVFYSRSRQGSSHERRGDSEAEERNLTPSMINIQYRPPEMLLGKVYDEKVDIWTLGCFLAQIFLGHPPFFQLPSLPSSSSSKGLPPGGNTAEMAALRQRKQAGNSKSAQTELEQLAYLCHILGPLPRSEFMEEGEVGEEGRQEGIHNTGGGGSALHSSTPQHHHTKHSGSSRHPHLPRHHVALRMLYRNYLQEKNAPHPLGSSGGLHGGVGGDKSSFKIFPSALFEPSPVYRQYRGFRRWFMHAVEERKLRIVREALMKSSSSPPFLPLLPSEAAVDVLCSIFTLSEHRRPSAEKLLEMPFFFFIDLAVAPLPAPSFPSGSVYPSGKGSLSMCFGSTGGGGAAAAAREKLLQHSPTLQQILSGGGSTYSGVITNALLRPGSTAFRLPRRERADVEKAIRRSLSEKLMALQVESSHHHPRHRPTGGDMGAPPPARTTARTVGSDPTTFKCSP